MSSKVLLYLAAIGYSLAAGAQSAPAANDTAPAAPSGTRTTPSDVVGVLDALDQHLADTLKDPMAASQYSVSEMVPCVTVVDAKDARQQSSDSMCICYRLDAKNAAGSALGGQLNVAMASKDNGVYRLAEVPAQRLSAIVSDGCKNLTSRDADNIHKRVK